ncbi:insecticidal delta-endotoxin Cry8Ea1 family protein [Bacillus thuringiensis]
MKYKNRKHAKRKYKQALLATVATMTLGVSTLGSTASALAAEDITETRKVTPQLRSADPIADGIFKIAADGTITLLNANLFDSATAKAIASLGGNLLKQLYLDAYNNDFTGSARTLVLGATALVPYVGSFVSPIIGLLWPANTSNNIAKQTEALVKMMHQEITNYDLEALAQEVKTLAELTSRFDDLLNGKPLSAKEYAETGTIQETLRTKASAINDQFIRVLNQCQKSSFKSEELPIYTTVATARLLFLNVIELHGQGPKMQMDDATYGEYVKDFKNLPTEFTNYIEATHKKTIDEMQKQMKPILDEAKKDPMSVSGNEQENIKNMEKRLAHWRDEVATSKDPTIKEYAKFRRDKMQGYLNAYRGLVNAKSDYIKKTVDNTAFKLVKESLSAPVEIRVPDGNYRLQSALDTNMSVGLSDDQKNIELRKNNDQLNTDFILTYSSLRKTYEIRSSRLDSNLYMTGSYGHDINNVFTMARQYSDSQHWKVLKARGSEFMYLKNYKTSQVLDIFNANPNNGANIITWPLKPQDQNPNNQQFKLVPLELESKEQKLGPEEQILLWDSHKPYKKGDIVKHQDKTYKCIQDYNGDGNPEWIFAKSLWKPISNQ